MRGLISRIEGTRTEDGPGIRTNVFLKGCPLHCPWCHNPESMTPGQELAFVKSRCDNCGDCIDTCPKKALRLKQKQLYINRELCDDCLLCVETCLSGALRPAGCWYEPETLLDVVAVDAAFYHYSKGGVTFSGGEPLFQPQFLEESLRLLKSRGIRTAIQTSGLASSALFMQIIELVDFVMFDLKILDETRHRQLLGQGNKIILKNLELLAEQEKAMEVRIPLVKSYTDDNKNIRGIAELLLSLEINTIKILIYHDLGISKAEWIPNPSNNKEIEPVLVDDVSRVIDIFERRGLSPCVKGEVFIKK